MIWNICGKISGVCSCFGWCLEHLPGDFPGFVAVSALLWNILGSFFSGFCSCFGGFMEHLPEVYLEFATDDLVTKYHHTNLSCLRQSRRRQTSLALKAPRAFNLSKLGAPNCFRALNRSAQAGRRAQSFQSKRKSIAYNAISL